MIDDPRADDDPRGAGPDFDSQPDDSQFWPAGLDLSPAGWPPPLSLRIIAFLFILGGILGLLEMLLHPVVHGGFHIDILALLLLFTGRGLLRWQNGWRYFALFFGGAMLMAGAFILLVSVSDLFTGEWKVGGVGSLRGGPWLGVIVGAFIFACAVFLLRTLNQRDIDWRFQNRQLALQLDLRQRSWNPLRWRFSLGSIFLAMVVASLVLVRVTAEDVWYDTSQQSITRSGRGTTQSFKYAVGTSRFSNAQRKLKYVVAWDGQQLGFRVDNRGRLTVDNAEGGWQQELPIGTRQLHEIVDGEVRAREERVTLAELEDFLKSRSDDWSLDALVKHAEELRAGQKAAADAERQLSPGPL